MSIVIIFIIAILDGNANANGYYAGDIFRLNEGPAMLDDIDTVTVHVDEKWWKFKNIFVEKP